MNQVKDDSPWDPSQEEWDPSIYLTGPQQGHGRRVIWDAEGDGLLFASEVGQRVIKEVTTFWCVGAVDIDTEEYFYWGPDSGPDSMKHCMEFLSQCDLLLAHNGIGYDYPAAEKLYPLWFKRPKKAWDTLVIAKVVWPYDVLIGPDLTRIKQGKLPPRLLKSHSLEAWGYRTGTFKGHYTGGFDEWKPSMSVYMMGDIRGTLALWRLIEKRIGWDPEPTAPLRWPELTLEVENEVARIIQEQEWTGVRFDLEKAIKLAADLTNLKADMERKLVEVFGSWWQPLADPDLGVPLGSTMKRKLTAFPDITKRRYSEKTGKELKPYVGPPEEHLEKGDLHVPIEYVTFNPGSRDHLGMRLQAVFGWKPKKFGANGKPTADETTLEEIPEAVIPEEVRKLILDYFIVAKTLGTLSKGRRAWITMASGPTKEYPWHTEGRIHGQMDTSGAVTRRGTHKNPNLSGTPSVKKAKGPDGKEHVVKGLEGRYGWECRELFIADDGWEETGVDASSLELIDLGHYLYSRDGGKFSERVCDPTRDPHTEHSELTQMTRADTKTTTYLYVYGGSAYKLSLALDVTPEEIPELLTYRGLPMLLRALEKRFDADFVRKMDDRQKAKLAKARLILLKFEKGIEGIKDLKDNITEVAARGWLKAIDGSRIHVRKKHAALNSILQSAGAISCKVWMMLVHRRLEELGYVKGRDWKQILWVHDELQFTHRPGLGPIIKQVAEECMVLAGEMLGLKGRYRTDGKTGANWAECH